MGALPRHADRAGGAGRRLFHDPRDIFKSIGRVCITVAQTDRALAFYVGVLGFEKPTTIALAPPPPRQSVGGAQTGILLETSALDGDRVALEAAGVVDH